MGTEQQGETDGGKASSASSQAHRQLTAQLRAEVAFLRSELEASRAETTRKDELLAVLAQRLPDLPSAEALERFTTAAEQLLILANHLREDLARGQRAQEAIAQLETDMQPIRREIKRLESEATAEGRDYRSESSLPGSTQTVPSLPLPDSPNTPANLSTGGRVPSSTLSGEDRTVPTIRREVSRRVAFALDSRGLTSLDEILTALTPSRIYNVSLADGHLLPCADAKSVLRLPNIRTNPIVSILSTASVDEPGARLRIQLLLRTDQSKTSITYPSYSTGLFGGSPTIQYAAEGEEARATLVIRQIEDWLTGVRQPFYFDIPARLNELVVVFAPLLIVFLVAAYASSSLPPMPTSQWSWASATGQLAIPVLLFALGIVIDWLRTRLLPIAVFAIGDGDRRYRLVKFFWVVIVLSGIVLPLLNEWRPWK